MAARFISSWLLVARYALAAGEGLCTSAEDAGCLEASVALSTSTEIEDPAVQLLQRTAARQVALQRHRDVEINATRVWAEIKAAVHVDQLTEQLEQAKDSHDEYVQKMQEQLQQLKQQFPFTKEVKQHFVAQWENITKAVDEETLKESIHEALEAGSDRAHELQEQLQALKDKTPEDVVHNIQNQTAQYWKDLQDEGYSLPDLDDLSDQAQEAVKNAQKSISGLWNSTFGDIFHVDDVKQALHNAQDRWQHWKEGLHESLNNVR